MAQEAVGPPPEETLSLWKREQALLKARVVDQDTEAWQRDPAFAGLQRVGGVDVSFVKGDSVRACASLVVLSYPELEVLYEDSCLVRLTAPYLSGFLAFREVPFLVDAVRRLREKEPSLVPQADHRPHGSTTDRAFCGSCRSSWWTEMGCSTPEVILLPRGFGVACHLGVLTDLPCVGVAKKLLQVDGLEKDALHRDQTRLLRAGGDSFPLMGRSGAVLGRALRSHDRSSKPLYVSVGHKMSLEAAVRLTHSCCRFRVPEPVRQADIRSRDHIRRTLGGPQPPAPGRRARPVSRVAGAWRSCRGGRCGWGPSSQGGQAVGGRSRSGQPPGSLVARPQHGVDAAPSPRHHRKARRPKAWPEGGPQDPSGEGRTPEAHSPGPRTHPEAPDPGAQER
ncbi:hypothetical protein QTO34_008685 [Cnephaeus nilssonii]|uniref:Endonuclease V n=1 Tax=Cnephaeus nilssonii TaxID=3371016 RepID=A0AA40HH62_CNENI|nr:hypothetical protein QTO34_008685 [Eptesicus nilssonii]